MMTLRRVKVPREQRKLLGRIDLLFDPLDQAPRAVCIDKDCISVSTNAQRAVPYDFVVVDEAHHIYSNAALRIAIEAHISSANCRRLLLSDVSQSLGAEIAYPTENMICIELTEVVRSSQRIVAGANAFRCDAKVGKQLPRCFHDSTGPPLVPFLFDTGEGARFESYATGILAALQHVTSTFPGLRLHDRLAILVPDAAFRIGLQSQLIRSLAGSTETRLQALELVDAQQASRACVLANANAPRRGKDWLVLDTVDEFDGLERLVVIAVGLDSRIDDSAATLDTRSRLYRALTRAHMMVLVVNEKVRGGWLDFLGQVDFDENFDAEVEGLRTSNEATRVVARNLEIRKRVEGAAEAAGVVLGREVQNTMESLVVEAVEGGSDVVVATEVRQHVQRYAEHRDAIGAALDAAGFSAAQIGQEAADKEAAGVAAAVLRGHTVTDAVGKAKVRSELAERIAELTSGAGLNIHALKELESIAFIKVTAGAEVGAAAAAIMQQWTETKALVATLLSAEAREQKLPADDEVRLQENVVLNVLRHPGRQSTEGIVQAAVRAECDRLRQPQIWAALETRCSVERNVKNVLACDITAVMRSGSIALDAAVDEALESWKELNVALESAIRGTQILSFEDGEKATLAARIFKCRADPGWVLEDAVQQQLDELQRQRQQKQPKQSVWDTSVTFDGSLALGARTDRAAEAHGAGPTGLAPAASAAAPSPLAANPILAAEARREKGALLAARGEALVEAIVAGEPLDTHSFSARQ